jgi:hypothetical protein
VSRPGKSHGLYNEDVPTIWHAHTSEEYVSYTSSASGPGHRNRYGDWLRAGRSGVRSPVKARISVGPTQLPVQWVTDIFHGDKAAGGWC